LYSSPSAIETKSKGSDKLLTKVISDSKRETHNITVQDASKIKKGDWVILKMVNNDKNLITYDTKPLVVEPEWTKILNIGVL
ncbi:hypothetical protein, partial [Saccharophagus degradans]